MDYRKFLRPSSRIILIFLLVSVIFLYFAREKACGAGFSIAFCYSSYGFPLDYVITGDVDVASGYIKDSSLGAYYTKAGNFLFNPLNFALDIAAFYLASCFINLLFNLAKKQVYRQEKS